MYVLNSPFELALPTDAAALPPYCHGSGFEYIAAEALENE